MKADMFLKLGPVKGDSVDAKHKGEIELTRVSWGMAVPGSPAGGVGRVTVEEIVLTKRVDVASPLLHSHCCCGMLFDEAVIVKRKAGKVPLEYFRLTLKEVCIASVELQIGGGEGDDMEVIKLRFSEFVEEFVPQNADGTGGGAIRHGYSVTKNVKL